MKSIDDLFLLYLKLTLFSFDKNDNAVPYLNYFGVNKANSEITFEIGKLQV